MADNGRRSQLETVLSSHLEAQFNSLVTDEESAINAAIKEVGNLIREVAGTGEEDLSLEQLQDTLLDFRRFAWIYYRVIQQLVGKRDSERLAKALLKIQQEIFVLRRLTEQRWSPYLRYPLRLADLWATNYLNHLRKGLERVPDAQSRGFVSKIARNDKIVQRTRREREAPATLRDRFLTFVEDDHRIHLGALAYNRNPSISIPLIHACQPGHWMGLAHEVGHFIFNNEMLDFESSSGREQQLVETAIRQSIFKQLSRKYINAEAPHRNTNACLGIAQSIPLWCAWAEELFADVLGAITLGPAYIESLIFWMAPRLHDAQSLVANDRDHPLPCLRPIFQGLVLLNRLGDHGNETVKAQVIQVLTDWLAYCECRFEHARWLPPPTEDNVPTQSAAVDKILAHLARWQSMPGVSEGVPFNVLFDQVGLVVDAVAEALAWAPVFTEDRFLAADALTKSLKSAKRLPDALRAQSSASQPDDDENRVFLLVSFWKARSRQQLLSKDNFRAMIRAWATPSDITKFANVPIDDESPMAKDELSVEDVTHALCPLLMRDERWALPSSDNPNQSECVGAGIALIERIWDTPLRKRTAEEKRLSLDLADWLLDVVFAVAQDIWCPSGQSCCPKPSSTV